MLVAWGEERPDIRALILTSTRARPGAPVDAFSDFDVIVAVTDVDSFVAGEAWRFAYGEPLVQWGDENSLYGYQTVFRGVIYGDGVKIDYTLWPHALLPAVGAPLPPALDVGYRVLFDKDGATEQWPPPTYRAHIPAPPTEAAYRAVIDEFWWSATYAAKALRRSELFFAKFVLERELKDQTLRPMLEWRVELDHEWSLKPGAFGRGLERLLPPALWRDLARTYVGVDVDENWTALFALADVFGRAAADVGAALGFAYPADLHARMLDYLETMRTAELS